MKNYALISLFPQMFKSLTDSGVSSRAIDKGLADLHFFNPRDYTLDAYKRVDEAPFGGGPGMVMLAEPLAVAHAAAQSHLQSVSGCAKKHPDAPKTIYFAPHGKILTQSNCKDYTKYNNLILICGRYEGVDQRFIDQHVDEVVSVGDYILSGGELPAMVFLDSVLRLLPGSIKDKSQTEDSFSANLLGLLEAPQYTRPAIWRDISVPQVLLSGDHNKIKDYRDLASLDLSASLRPDLLRLLLAKLQRVNGHELGLSDKQKKWLKAYVLGLQNQI